MPPSPPAASLYQPTAKTMHRIATICFALVLAFGWAASASAQTAVTIREINDVPDANIQQLIDLGSAATSQQVVDLSAPTLLGETVSFTAVVLTDPFNSGLANLTDGEPQRVHMFVRDVAAADQGFEGMTIQVVDGTRSIEELLVGDVVNMIGDVGRFNQQIQIAPSSFEVIDEVPPGDPLLAPVTITTDDIHLFVAEGDPVDQMTFRWENYESLNNQYVRLENAQVVNSISRPDGRPAFIASSPGTETLVDTYDTSIRYRNDRGDYPSRYNVREDDYIPPPAGSFINLQGYLVAVGANFNYQYGVPPGAVFSIAPFADSDLEELISAPVISDLNRPDVILGDGDEFTVSVEVVPDPTRTIDQVVLIYELSSGGGEQSVVMTNTGGDTYEASIPAVGDGVFVTYRVEAVDNEGLMSSSPNASYRVLFDGIDEIEDVQLTASAGPGSSPFLGLTAPVTIDAVVMSDPDVSGFLTIQDDPSLAPWTGVFVELTLEIAGLGLQPGDRVQVRNATIGENFGVTELQDAEILTPVEPGDPYAYKVVPTGVLAQDAPTAEAHEGMALRFTNVEITDVNADDDTNPDNNFGEWQFSSDGTQANEIRADDASDAIAQDFNVKSFTLGQELGAIQGLWWFSFGNYKLVPESADDLDFTVDAEDGAQAGAFGLKALYPNPASDAAAVRFTTTEQADVRLDVYDVVGRRVAVLVDGPLAAATHTATLDARSLAGGVYLVRLQAGGRTATQKLVLIK